METIQAVETIQAMEDVLRYPRLWRQYKRSRAMMLLGMMSLRLREIVLLAGRAVEAGAQGGAEVGAYLPTEAGPEVEVGVKVGTGLLAEVVVVVVTEGAPGVVATVRVGVAHVSLLQTERLRMNA